MILYALLNRKKPMLLTVSFAECQLNTQNCMRY